MRRLLCALLVGAVAGPAQEREPFQRGVVVAPESVTVGDPFRVVIRVRAPVGTVLDFPEAPDSVFKVEPLDRVVLVDASDTTAVEVSATYRLAAWDVGVRPLRFADVLATLAGRTARIAVGRELAVTVVSVLPADSAQRLPRPPRPVYEFGLPWWWWAAVAVAVALLGIVFWWWWQRRPRGAPITVDPYAAALRSFERVDGLALVSAGESGHHLTLMTDVVREYLARVRPSARIALTTNELIHALRGDRTVPLTRVARVLHEADLVKFAQQRMTAADATAHGAECRAVVDAVHQLLHAPPVHAAKAA